VTAEFAVADIAIDKSRLTRFISRSRRDLARSFEGAFAYRSAGEASGLFMSAGVSGFLARHQPPSTASPRPTNTARRAFTSCPRSRPPTSTGSAAPRQRACATCCDAADCFATVLTTTTAPCGSRHPPRSTPAGKRRARGDASSGWIQRAASSSCSPTTHVFPQPQEPLGYRGRRLFGRSRRALRGSCSQGTREATAILPSSAHRHRALLAPARWVRRAPDKCAVKGKEKPMT
jgi:hypothetical protein